MEVFVVVGGNVKKCAQVTPYPPHTHCKLTVNVDAIRGFRERYIVSCECSFATHVSRETRSEILCKMTESEANKL